MKYDTTQESIFEWLQESTGRHMLDSGGAYGRNWERNQKKSFEDFKKLEPTITIGWREGKDYKGEPFKDVDVMPDIPIFLWLSEVLKEFEIDDHCKKYMKWWETPASKEDWDWGENGAFIPDEAIKFAGLHKHEKTGVCNTYNEESYVSQVMQYTTLMNDDGDLYLALSIHQGCDVRGGYTVGRIFKYSGDPSPSCYFLALNTCPNMYTGIPDTDYGLDIMGTEVMWYDHEKGDNFDPTNDEKFELIKNAVPEGQHEIDLTADIWQDQEWVYDY